MNIIAENIFEIVNEYAEKTAKECYKLIKVEDETPFIMESKLGGMPYIPKGKSVPRDTNGDYMALLLQINLSDIKMEGYPESGILEIFSSKKIDYPQEYKILYFEDNLEPELELPFVETEDFFVMKPMKVELKKTIVHMPLTDYRSTSIFNEIIKKYGTQINSIYDLDKDIINRLQDAIITVQATIGGYADFTQDDPRMEEDNRDECLFKLDSLFDRNIFIGDAGILTVTGSKEDLKENNFDSFVLDWDCC